jgi:hypothetical protein
MIVRLEIPDILYELYLTHAKGDDAKVPTLLVQQLDRFRRVNPTDRILLIGAHERAKLEEMLPLPLPQIADGKDLLQRVDALAHIEIGGVAVRFNQRDLRAIASHAEKNSLSVQEAVEYTVGRMKDNFISYLAEATAAAAMPTEGAPEEPEAVPAPSAPPAAVASLQVDEVQELAAETDALAAVVIPQLRVQDPRATVEPESYAEEGTGRLLNPSTVDPKDQKVEPRKPTPHVHARRRATVETPASTGGEMRPSGWGAGSRQ